MTLSLTSATVTTQTTHPWPLPSISRPRAFSSIVFTPCHHFKHEVSIAENKRFAPPHVNVTSETLRNSITTFRHASTRDGDTFSTQARTFFALSAKRGYTNTKLLKIEPSTPCTPPNDSQKCRSEIPSSRCSKLSHRTHPCPCSSDSLLRLDLESDRQC